MYETGLSPLPGLLPSFLPTHGLRRGLHSCAATAACSSSQLRLFLICDVRHINIANVGRFAVAEVLASRNSCLISVVASVAGQRFEMSIVLPL